MRTIGVVTVARSDWGIYRPVVAGLARHPGLSVRVVVTGMHLSPEFGSTVRLIEQDGYRDFERVESLLASDSPAGIAKSIGIGVAGFADLFSRWRPDILLVLGDRFEMHAAALAALPFLIPVAHIHGGEVTAGAIDEALRHGITKLSHIHFPTTAQHARRIRQLGEESWRISVAGAPSLDQVRRTRIPSRRSLEKSIGRALPDQFLLVTYHPETLAYAETGKQVTELMAALERVGVPALFTLPNADTNGRVIRDAIRDFVARHPESLLVENLGTERYFGAMTHAAAMVGNSSSGIIEAASFKLPVVNIGIRQQGRQRSENVLDCTCRSRAISAAIKRALGPTFVRRCRLGRNVYDQGGATKIIVQRLASVPINRALLTKRFADLPIRAAR